MASLTNIPPNRVVALLTPTLFAPLAGAIAVAAAEVAPGTNVDETSITAIFIAGATIAFGKAAQWTKGWQAQEQRDAEAALAAADHDTPVDLTLDDDGDDAFGDEHMIEDEDEDAFGDELAALEDADERLTFDEAQAIEEELLAMSAAPEE